MHVLITGAGGFSGSHLVAALLAKGHTVTAVCGRSHGRLEPGAFPGAPLAIVCGDLAQPLPLPPRIDAVVHAAARSLAPGVGVGDMIRDNAMATAQLVAYARSAAAKTFIYLSSLSVNGRIAGPVVDEETPIVDPDAYGMTKYLGELLLREEPSLRSLSIRLPGVIGKSSVRNWMTSVLEAAKAGNPISIYNEAASYNNAVHIEDLSRFVDHTLADPLWKGHDAVTLGAAGLTTVRGAVETLVEALGSSSSIETAPSRRPPFVVSSRRAQEIYSYSPMNIDNMLRKFASENQS